jgi:hypothetical protein
VSPKAAPAPVTAVVEEVQAVEAVEEAQPEKAGPGNGLLEFVGKRNKEIAELLAFATVEAEGDAVNISVAARQGAKLTLLRPQLEACLKDFYGRPVSTRINGNGAAQNGAPKNKDADPVLKDALRILGGRIIEDRRGTNV